MKRLIAVSSLILVAALLFPGAAYAAESQQGQVVMGGKYTLESGEVLHGDLVIFGGAVVLEEGSLVQGDVLLFGGNAEIAGEIEGDMAVLGGNVDLASTAVIGHDLVTLGGNVDRAPGASVGGEFVSANGFHLPLEFDLPDISGVTRIRPLVRSNFGPVFSPVTGLLWFGFRSLVVAALAILVVLIWPNPPERAGRAAVSQPIVAGGLGCLTFLALPFIFLLLVITIIGIPLVMLGSILLVIAIVFGWIAIGVEIGRRMKEAFEWELHPAAAAGIGTLAVSLVVGGIGLIPCVGWLAPLLVGAAGVGAVILTRFGSREYVPATAAAELPPPEGSKAVAKKSTAKKSSSKKSSSKK